MKLITFTVPCYNSAAYMDHCIHSLLPAGEECEIILVDDGSTDDTGAIADRYAREYPDLVRVVHQENSGHGEGVNQGLRRAEGMYFKVVDSDDWLDGDALNALLGHLRSAARMSEPVDLYLCNYVYEHAVDHTQRVMRYTASLPVEQAITWDDIGHFDATHFITMHACVYRTAMLREAGLELPKHTFYVDNLVMYQPLPHVKKLYYINIDLYRYYIGRDDQSVTEANLIRRIDQHILITKLVIQSHDLAALKKTNRKLAEYMYHFVSMMMMICTIYLMLSGTGENLAKSDALWQWLRDYDEKLYRRLRYRSANVAFLLPGRAGRRIDLFCYKLIRKIYKFN